jgi:quinol monooxygenase YgiN
MAPQGQVVAIYEAEVQPEQRATLRKAYAALAHGLPTDVLHTFLVPPQPGGTAWHLVVMWRSRAAFEAHRDAQLLPGFAISGTGSI